MCVCVCVCVMVYTGLHVCVHANWFVCAYNCCAFFCLLRTYKTNGQCNCRENVIGRACDTCRPGFFNLNGANPLGCEPCMCDVSGSSNLTCDPINGQCECNANITGRQCNMCVVSSEHSRHWYILCQTHKSCLSENLLICL